MITPEDVKAIAGAILVTGPDYDTYCNMIEAIGEVLRARCPDFDYRQFAKDCGAAFLADTGSHP